MLQFTTDDLTFRGSTGSLAVAPDDLLTQRLAMLLEGECELGAASRRR